MSIGGEWQEEQGWQMWTIYALRNRENDWRYIGSTRNLRTRLYQHRSQLRSGRARWYKHGPIVLEDLFTVEILEEPPESRVMPHRREASTRRRR